MLPTLTTDPEETSMSERAIQLQITADAQIAKLIELVSELDAATLQLSCPGREKLGDGSVAALAQHTADNYQRIAAFAQVSDRRSSYRPPPHAKHDPATHADSDRYAAASVDPHELVDQLSIARDALERLAALSDSQLDAIPPRDSFRFCDGQRTLGKVLTGLLKHQGHQVEVLTVRK
jgi:hypothetical protein